MTHEMFLQGNTDDSLPPPEKTSLSTVAWYIQFGTNVSNDLQVELLKNEINRPESFQNITDFFESAQEAMRQRWNLAVLANYESGLLPNTAHKEARHPKAEFLYDREKFKKVLEDKK